MKKSVLIFGTTDTFGGVGHIIHDLCFNVDKTKVKFDFMYYEPVSKMDLEWIKSLGGNFYLTPRYSRHPIQYLKYIFKFYKEHSYDIVHCHASSSTVILYTLPLWFFQKHTKIFFHSHNDNAGTKLMHYLFREIVKLKCNKYIAVSQCAGKWMYGNQIKSDKFLIIKNGININQYIFNENTRNIWRTKLNIQDNFVIGHIGRFHIQKNHEFLIDIFENIYAQKKNALLLLIGSGELEETIKKKVASKDFRNNVIFYGNTDNISELLQAMDVFVFPSNWEGLGIVVVEAQTTGLPVVAATTVPEEANITPLFHYLSLDQSPKTWSAFILNLKKEIKRISPTETIINAGYDIKNIGKELENLYTEEG